MTVKAPKKEELESIEIASRDEISGLQYDRLKWSLNHAYANVAHYKEAFDGAGVHPDDLKDLADLAKFPFTVKDDLRKHSPFGMFAVPQDEIVRVHASSGTTGNPTVVAYTQNDIDMWANLMARSIRASGGRRGDRVHIAFGYGLFTGGLGCHYGAERLGCMVTPMSGGQTEKQVKLIQDFEPDIIMVTPSYLLAIADEFERQGLDARQTSLKVSIHGAEPWTEAAGAAGLVGAADIIFHEGWRPPLSRPELTPAQYRKFVDDLNYGGHYGLCAYRFRRDRNHRVTGRKWMEQIRDIGVEPREILYGMQWHDGLAAHCRKLGVEWDPADVEGSIRRVIDHYRK